MSERDDVRDTSDLAAAHTEARLREVLREHERRMQSYADTAVVAALVSIVGAYVAYRTVLALKADAS